MGCSVFLPSWPRILLALLAVSAGCAEGSATFPDGRPREARSKDLRLEEAAPAEARTVLDRAPGPDLPLPRERGADLPRDQRAPSEGACGCGAGMTCVDGACRCDPATCAGCCSVDGKACRAGRDSKECGLGGATCAVCSTTDSCKTASCATGTCQVTLNPGAAYPCPGAFGTACGGGSGVACYSGLTCVTFSAGGKGFCSKPCPSSGWPCTGAPAGMTAECALSAGSQWYCGFVCSPGSCPTGLSCDYFEKLCKP